MLELVDAYTWPNDGINFAGIGIRLDDLAFRLGVTAHTWNVDGLGPARGFGFRAASGRVYLLQELKMPALRYDPLGPDVYVDAAELATVGMDTLVDDVALALGVDRHEVVITANESVLQDAVELVARCSAARSKRGL